MLNINTNYASAFASNAAKTASKGLESAMEKLSSGSRINYAKDDAAGQAISTRLSAEIQGLEMASRNAADAQSFPSASVGPPRPMSEYARAVRFTLPCGTSTLILRPSTDRPSSAATTAEPASAGTSAVAPPPWLAGALS